MFSGFTPRAAIRSAPNSGGIPSKRRAADSERWNPPIMDYGRSDRFRTPLHVYPGSRPTPGGPTPGVNGFAADIANNNNNMDVTSSGINISSGRGNRKATNPQKRPRVSWCLFVFTLFEGLLLDALRFKSFSICSTLTAAVHTTARTQTNSLIHIRDNVISCSSISRWPAPVTWHSCLIDHRGSRTRFQP